MTKEPGLHLGDCMDAMREFPDKFFDLAIVDPPYGGGAKNDVNAKLSGGGASEWEHKKRSRFGGLFDRYDFGGADGRKLVRQVPGTNAGGGLPDNWDVAPPKAYFDELGRVSKNQIIWGGNYFDLPPTRCFLVWDKGISEAFSMAMCEYAWTSFNENAKMYKCAPQGNRNNIRIHPTQKPVALYSWILRLFSKPGMKILDTHAGSASSVIACRRAGLECWAYEINETYYRLASSRIERESAQTSIFDITGAEQMAIREN